MPNPLIKVGRMATSKKPQDHDEGKFDFGNTNMPDNPPEMEHVAGDNHPYRGAETHGVADTVDPKDVVKDYQATMEGVTYLPEPDDVKPIPVVIRNQAGREYRKSRVHHWTWDGNTVIQIMPRNGERVYAKIYNIGNQVIAVSTRRENASMQLGYILNAQNPFLEINSQEEFYAWNNGAGGAFAEVQVYEEYTVEL